ncbi:MAG: glycerol-3-phosphate 1-O-acyltransferase PlsY [Dissulfurispiraceae bacterium]
MIIVLIVISFVIGSIPTGLLIAKSRGINLRKIGSGNIGTTNVLRAMGKEAALITLAGDMAKGVIPVMIARHFFQHSGFQIVDFGVERLNSLMSDQQSVINGLAGIFAILGHNFSIFLKFKGGKGVATSLGVALAISPYAALLTATIWLLTFRRTGYSSLSALVSFGLLPLSVYLTDNSREKILTAIIIAILIFIRHKSNINRLLHGTEQRMSSK